jgi:hypothetical protein
MSARDPVERLECADVFDRQEVSQDYADRIVGFAFAETATAGVPEPALAKWPGKLRILVWADTEPRTFLIDTIRQFQADLQDATGQEVPVLFDLTARGPLADGDLVVYLSWAFGTDRAATDQRRSRVTRAFYGSDQPPPPPMIGIGADSLDLADVSRDEKGAIRRALVVMDQPYAHLGGQAEMTELLTSVLNPNPGNAVNLGLPGSTPQEKRIYKAVWRTSTEYNLYWTREFGVYVGLLSDSRIAPGATKNQFAQFVGARLSEPAMKTRLADLYGCQQ